jgi:hypothetical protein
MNRRLIAVAFAILTILPLAACVIEPVPPKRPGVVWVPGHYNGWRWVPGHWA